jgi:hypothetical protein
LTQGLQIHPSALRHARRPGQPASRDAFSSFAQA